MLLSTFKDKIHDTIGTVTVDRKRGLGQPIAIHKEVDISYTATLARYADKTALAKKLVGIALNAEPKVSLQAIEYIYDRIEPIVKQVDITTTDNSTNSVVQAIQDFNKTLQSIEAVKIVKTIEADIE